MFSNELLPSCFDEIQKHSNYKLNTGFMDGKFFMFIHLEPAFLFWEYTEGPF